MASSKAGEVLVVDQGRLLGVVTQKDVMRTIQTRQELELGPSRPSGGLRPAQFPRIEAGHCIQCGALLPADVKFCPQCGAKQTP